MTAIPRMFDLKDKAACGAALEEELIEAYGYRLSLGALYDPRIDLDQVQVILYVADQAASARFYARLLGRQPSLDVPGMTEFELPGVKLGLMPERGIARILGEALPHPSSGAGVPRCELYLRVGDPEAWFACALELGARAVSPVSPRDWGDRAGYVADADGHVLAFAAQG